ncbi:ankyrin repeat domain-containing protein [Aquabacterium sp. OR-4]|uniref:ankyrin repeat domain-containing protein n=1 Tax=Aquabacterium sp. OR-4 TaxID=2978127 RepID=UPI0021B41EB4|nr:ankyrin repeat domain-containing protein [Aquabacterium sp. OR-4]MDT7838936.1 ankyrin repeat domain-containing protein [Aquabacterium sp. OR-4]
MRRDRACTSRLHAHRRLALARASACLLAALCGLNLPGAARAQDADPALAGFARARASAPRGVPVPALEWAQRLATPSTLGPVPLSAADRALLAAAQAGRWAECQALINGSKSEPAGRASATARDETGSHALPLAARAGQDELVRSLLRQGAEIDRHGSDGLPALAAAALAGQRSTVRLLLRAGADVARWSSGGQTALHLASVAGRLEVIDDLLRAGVPVDLLNRQRETALDVASAANQVDAMGRLLEAGADTHKAGAR